MHNIKIFIHFFDILIYVSAYYILKGGVVMFDKWNEILNLLNLYIEGVFNLDINKIGDRTISYFENGEISESQYDFITSIIMDLQLV